MIVDDFINEIKDRYNVGDKLILENHCKRKEEGLIIQKTNHFVVIQFKHWKESFNWFEIYHKAMETKCL